ncbi:Josephin-domain-containing protein [Serendipita vermifera]|nr:Josephin-domain-containing protein [Serendipita vermifera]
MLLLRPSQQDPGSMLCAQHALNALMQQPIFTAFDLASIAKALDTMEQSYDEGHKGVSMNMDDSGFFSVQVLENALQVWGLTLIRWRSKEMQAFQSKPHTRLGFILNLEEHWFTLRRFGPADPDPTKDPGAGHWFNLNSFLPEPEWVSKTYLGMMLQQAEAEGYSVFVVSQINPNDPIALPRTEADELATVTPEITGGSTRMSTSRSLNPSTSKTPTGDWTPAAEGLDNEDLELQRALLASVGAEVPPASTSTKPVKRESISEEWDIGNARSLLGDSSHRGKGREVTSAAHDRMMEQIARFKEEQERAMNDPTESDDIIASVLSKRQGVPKVSEPVVPQKRPRKRQEDEEEEEMMRRAIEASQKESQSKEDDKDEEDEDPSYDDDEHHFYDEEEERVELERLFQERSRQKKEQDAREKLRVGLYAPSPQPLEAVEPFDPFTSGMLGANAAHLENRIYDDEDAELQAALKASLEDAPGGISLPPPQQPVRAATRAESPKASTSTSKPDTSAVTSVKGKATQEENEDSEEESEDEEMEEEPEEKPKPLTAEEMRKARLARFGG